MPTKKEILQNMGLGPWMQSFPVYAAQVMECMDIWAGQCVDSSASVATQPVGERQILIDLLKAIAEPGCNNYGLKDGIWYIDEGDEPEDSETMVEEDIVDGYLQSLPALKPVEQEKQLIPTSEPLPEFQASIDQMQSEDKLFIDLTLGISDVIRQRMNQRRITQKALSDLLGKAEPEISKWLSGMHNFTLRTICKLESVLGSIITTATASPIPASQGEVEGYKNSDRYIPMEYEGDVDKSMAFYRQRLRESHNRESALQQQLSSCQEELADYKTLFEKSQKAVDGLIDQLAKAQEERDAFRKACQNFVDKVTRGEARSKRTFAEMSELLDKYPKQ